MKPITKLYIKEFLITGLPYGIFTSAFDVFSGEDFIVWKFLFSTVFFGLFMSLFFVGIHKRRLKKIGINDITEDYTGLSQTSIMKTDLNLEQLIDKLKTEDKIANMKMSKIENGIMLKTGISLSSYGEEIRIILKSEKDSEYKYQVSSNSIYKLALVDYGKNLNNIKLIESVANSLV